MIRMTIKMVMITTTDSGAHYFCNEKHGGTVVDVLMSHDNRPENRTSTTKENNSELKAESQSDCSGLVVAHSPGIFLLPT